LLIPMGAEHRGPKRVVVVAPCRLMSTSWWRMRPCPVEGLPVDGMDVGNAGVVGGGV
jgi:hypothetical protein